MNINPCNIFIVHNALRKLNITKLEHICLMILEVNASIDETQIEEYKKDGHESMRKIINCEIFYEDELDHELYHFVKLEKRCVYKKKFILLPSGKDG